MEKLRGVRSGAPSKWFVTFGTTSHPHGGREDATVCTYYVSHRTAEPLLRRYI